MSLEIGWKRHVAALALLLGSQAPALAYTDLPGVRTPEELAAKQSQVCEQVLIRRDKWAEPTRGPRYTYAYSCEQGGFTVQSNRLPPSLERQKRGLNY